MLIKKKSLIVIILSVIVISSVLALTILGYVIYIELKSGGVNRACSVILQKLHANR